MEAVQTSSGRTVCRDAERDASLVALLQPGLMQTQMGERADRETRDEISCIWED